MQWCTCEATAYMVEGVSTRAHARVTAQLLTLEWMSHDWATSRRLRKLAREVKLEYALPALENAAGPDSGHTRSCIHRESACSQRQIWGVTSTSPRPFSQPCMGKSHINGKQLYAKEWEGLSVWTCLLYQFRMNPSLNCLTLSGGVDVHTKTSCSLVTTAR